VDVRRLDRLAGELARFYRHAPVAAMSPERHLGDWRQRLCDNRRVLFDARLALDRAKLMRIDGAQRRFLAEGAALIADRVTRHRILEGHGDMRAEHVWLGQPLAVIDRLEFSRAFRLVDPFDELAGLAIECAALGGVWVGDRVADRVAVSLHDFVPPPLVSFYRCYRATLRARLAIAHLLAPDGRSPEKWPAVTQRYLTIAAENAEEMTRYLDRRRRRPHRTRSFFISGQERVLRMSAGSSQPRRA
jgi:aminoglycoside phosphotransferase family enzyme